MSGVAMDVCLQVWLCTKTYHTAGQRKGVGALDMAAHRPLHLKYDVSKITMDSPKGMLLTKMTNTALLTDENKDILFLEPVS